MSDTQIQLQNIADWVLRVNLYKAAQTYQEDGKIKYIPIPPLSLNAQLNARFIAVGILVQNAKPTWNHGGFLNQLYPFSLNTNVSPLGRAITESRILLINKVKIIQFPRISGASYQLLYSPQKWFRDVRIKVWQYRGTEANFTEDTLYQINQKVDQLLQP